MTSADLINELAGIMTVGSEKISFTKSQVLFAGTLAQNDILTRLKLVDQAIRLALAAGQESYTFAPQTPTVITADPDDPSNEVILTVADHPYHTGDEVVVAGITGIPTGNHYYVTYIDANHFNLDGCTYVNTMVVTASSRVYHALQAAVDLSDRAPIRKVSCASGALTGYITKKSHGSYEKFRDQFGPGPVDEPLVINCMVEYTAPCITLQFQGTPGVDILTEVKIARRPLPCEKLTETVDPILPPEYDDVFLAGTRSYMFNLREEQVFRGVMYARRYIPGPRDIAEQKYEAKLKALEASVNAQRVVYINTEPDQGWA